MSKYLPTYVAETVFDVDYNKLYSDGKRIILYDLDNTLISYEESIPSEKLIELTKKNITMGFKVFVLTNNHGKRIKDFMKTFPGTGYGSNMRKPGIAKIKKFLETEKINDKSQIIMIGDQLVTDIRCANKLNVSSVIVKSISRESEHFYTKINRLRERKIVKDIAKTDLNKASLIASVVLKGGYYA